MDGREIIGLFIAREERAVSEAQQACGAYLKKIALNILGDERDAEECVLDALHAAWNSIPPAEPDDLFAYLSRLTRNRALNLYAASRAQKRGSGGACVPLSELGEIASSSEDPVDSVQAEELKAAINGFLSGLPREKRNIFVSRYWYFDEIKDIAKRTGRTENNIAVMLSRLRGKLKKYLNERGFII
ncbi:MAG: sigma-70 family RNA polymerase sigma factor [Clostridiales bacterium]|nr:sigma-70 family RNA polymerase sigma factor [Clostridiales bacterium]